MTGPKSSGRKQRSVYLSVELIERVRAAVYWLRVVPGEASSFAEFAERALRAEVERVEGAYNRGRPFEMPEGETLRPGPAPGVMSELARRKRGGKGPGRASR